MQTASSAWAVPADPHAAERRSHCECAPAARLLVVPGLGDSPSGHWQSWLQAGARGALRVQQRDWQQPDLERWADRLASALQHAPHPGPWLVAAHNFGVLAVLRHLARGPDPRLAALLLVAPADPDRFGVAGLLPQHALSVPSRLVLSSNDPWMGAATGLRWAQRWQAAVLNLGAAGHVNIASGYGPWPYARQWLLAQQQQLARQRHSRPEPREAC